MNETVKKPVLFTNICIVSISMIWILYGRVTPIVCSALGIYIDEAKTLVITVIFSGIVANILNYAIPHRKLTIFQVAINIAICLLAQSVLRVFDQGKTSVVMFMTFIIIVGALIIINRKKANRKVRLLLYIRPVILFALIVFILPTQFYINFRKGDEYYSYIETDVKAENGKNDFDDFKETLHNIKWKHLSLEEKCDVIREFIIIEGTELGLKDFPSICFEDFENTRTSAFYEEENNKIHFNLYYIGTATKEQCIAVSSHELHHKYQIELINNTKTVLPKEVFELQYFDELSSWISANENYIEDKSHYDTYYNNALERSARDYSDRILQKYKLAN